MPGVRKVTFSVGMYVNEFRKWKRPQMKWRAFIRRRPFTVAALDDET
jgi:hypothetical protein